MRRHATPSLEALDPDVLAAARDVARRAGVSVESWIASVLPTEESAKPSPRRRRAADGKSDGKGDAKADPRPSAQPAPPAAAEARPEPVRAAPAHALAMQAPAAPPSAAEGAKGLDHILDALMERLDVIDQTIALERESAQEEARRRIGTLEAQLGDLLDSSARPANQMAERLGDIERRMVELADQFAAARPPGRRGRAAATEVRDAVEEIRQRQRQIEVGGERAEAAHGVVATMRRDLARRLDATVEEEEARPSSAAAISELRGEIGRLRESLGGLATGQDVGALERAMTALATDVRRAQQPADLAVIAAPIEAIRNRVERIAGDVADNVYGRIAGEMEGIVARIDTALASAPGGALDGEAIGGLFTELEEIRKVTAGLAGPERIQALVQAVQALSGQVEELRAGFAATAGVDSLRPLLEEIRSGLEARAPQDVSEQVEAIARRLDALHESAGRLDQTQSRAIIGRIDALADKVDRIDGLGESLRGQPVTGGEFASIHSMLANLAEKVDTVGRRTGGGESLDALEKQVLAIADRLDTRVKDPAIAGLERTMADLLGEVSALRDQAATVSAVEHAARNAVADTIGETPELGRLRAGLAELQARQSASDERMQATLDEVRGAIERLGARLVDGEAHTLPVRPAASEPSLEETLLSSTGLQAPRARSAQRPAAQRPAAAELPEAGRVADELLEPGAARPGRGRLPAEAEEGGSDIKTSFIAAARRAAQAAQVEVAAEAAAEAATRTERTRPSRKGLIADLPEPVAPARGQGLRATIEKRRKPLLLGLAAIVLVLGALQALTMGPSSDPAPAAPPAIAARQAPAEPERAAPLDPQTTQAIGERLAARPAPKPSVAPQSAPAPAMAEAPRGEPKAEAARSVLPRVGDMASLAGDLAGLPAGLAALKQQAIEGDGAAIYELAVREADGRGMTRDLALAARLYEKLATAGYAPAQYRLAGQYEKGSGVVRDLAQAKLWYARAAEQGHARSMHNLAVIYAENPSPSGKPDFATAGSWFRLAAEYGVRDSQYNLAVLYARGLGVGQDLVQSFAWFSAAAIQGDTEAGKKRDDVASKLSPEDLAKAKTIAATFKARRLDPAVNETPAVKDGQAAPMTLLGAPTPGATVSSFVPPAAKRAL